MARPDFVQSMLLVAATVMVLCSTHENYLTRTFKIHNMANERHFMAVASELSMRDLSCHRSDISFSKLSQNRITEDTACKPLYLQADSPSEHAVRRRLRQRLPSFQDAPLAAKFCHEMCRICACGHLRLRGGDAPPTRVSTMACYVPAAWYRRR
jgi:hypothetical protein